MLCYIKKRYIKNTCLSSQVQRDARQMLRNNKSRSHSVNLLWPFCRVSLNTSLQVTTVWNLLLLHSNPIQLHVWYFPTCSHIAIFFHSRCNRDPQTKVDLNGEKQEAHFSFEAFRFVQHKNKTVSTFFLHCVTRLCEPSACSKLFPVSRHQISFKMTFFKDITNSYLQ